MPVQRLHWLGNERRRRLTARLATQLGEWLTAWSVDATWLTLADRTSVHAPADDGWRWLRVATGQGALLLGAPRAQLAEVGARLAGAQPHDEFALGDRVGKRALDALLGRWAGAAGTLAEIHPAPPASAFAPRFGAAVYTLRGTGFDGVVLVEHDLCDVLAPPLAAVRAPLATRDVALVEAPVQLQVTLDLGEADLRDVSQLQVGDVLLADAGVDALFHLVHPDARPLADARLYRRGAQLALQVLPSHQAKSKP
ncbi:MAG TPA: FliM/FliN family flagellar motor switch protein [Verrucomicrobiae bacterium]|nr:FliM/FliN family flagellar motor switch protein [Verrucomicrobiae bacterium]